MHTLWLQRKLQRDESEQRKVLRKMSFATAQRASERAAVIALNFSTQTTISSFPPAVTLHSLEDIPLVQWSR